VQSRVVLTTAYWMPLLAILATASAADLGSGLCAIAGGGCCSGTSLCWVWSRIRQILGMSHVILTPADCSCSNQQWRHSTCRIPLKNWEIAFLIFLKKLSTCITCSHHTLVRDHSAIFNSIFLWQQISCAVFSLKLSTNHQSNNEHSQQISTTPHKKNNDNPLDFCTHVSLT
jgi:hypothetical protein